MMQHTMKPLQFSNNYDSVTKAEAVFLAVGTPSSDDGQADLQYVFKACDSIAPFLKEGSVVVVKSTVPVEPVQSSRASQIKNQ